MSTFSSMYAAMQGSKAQEAAADTAAGASMTIAREQMAMIREMHDEAINRMQPFYQYGRDAVDDAAFMNVNEGLGQYLQQIEGVGEYADEIANLEFEFDADDPIYEWRKAETERQVNQFYASRGGYDSRGALNALTDAGMALQSDEINRQFNQRYLTKYQQLKDAANIKLQTATTGFNARNQMNQGRYNQLIDAVKIGTGQSQAAGQLGSSTSNQLASTMGTMSQDVQNALLQQGAAQANMWSQFGQSQQSTSNALLSYFMTKGG